MKAGALLDQARRLVGDGSTADGGLRCRAAVLLARQALEVRALEMLTAHSPQIEDATFDARLLSLLAVMNDAELAKKARYVWAAMSCASHMHQYDLAPTLVELTDWIETVEQFLRAPSSSGSR